jgi:hypothetical protein
VSGPFAEEAPRLGPTRPPLRERPLDFVEPDVQTVVEWGRLVLVDRTQRQAVRAMRDAFLREDRARTAGIAAILVLQLVEILDEYTPLRWRKQP